MKKTIISISRIILYLLSFFTVLYLLILILDYREASNHPETYYFGSEAMIFNGGEYYRSQEVYLESSRKGIAISSLLIIVFGSLIFISIKKSKKIN